ncbi:MAG: cupin domain-containing protein [Muribaculum sp.]|nr:cupin domain-containing protein [Muribaculaceae bacterium]MCM1080225.1 cupin domain-containing protein [Muribaculum sp.]
MLRTDYQFGEVVDLESHFNFNHENIGFKNVLSDENGGVSLLSFAKGQSLPEHLAPANVMLTVIEGDIGFTMFGRLSNLKRGEFILMGKGVPHSIHANADSKIMLIKIK